MKLNRTTTALVAGSAAIALVLAGCSSDDSTDSTAANTTATSASQSSEAESSASVTWKDAYIKVKPADKDMTGIFGVLQNNTDKEMEIADFKVEGLEEGTVFEQHATKDGKMFKIQGGHKIPANGEFTLAPGGDHLMILENNEVFEQGQEFRVVINFTDGSSLAQDVEVRVQPAGEEEYVQEG